MRAFGEVPTTRGERASTRGYVWGVLPKSRVPEVPGSFALLFSMGCQPVGCLRATWSLSKSTQGGVTHFEISLSLFAGGGYPLGG